eukprot:856676-Pyramimonas_sp.AAC.1
MPNRELLKQSSLRGADANLGVNDRKGALWVITQSDVHERLVAKPVTEDTFSFAPTPRNFEAWGIAPAQVQGIIESV